MKIFVSIVEEKQFQDEQIAFAEIENGELISFGVFPEWRNMGYSEKLLQKILAELQERKIKMIRFHPANISYWTTMKNKFSNNIKIFPNGDGIIYA